MIRFFLSLAIALCVVLGGLILGSRPAHGQTVVERPSHTVGPISISLDGIPTSSLVTMLLRDVMRVPYVIAPDVLSDRRPTSVKLVIPRDKIPERVVGYLRRTGFSVEISGGTVYVGKAGSRATATVADPFVPHGSPLDPTPSIAPRSTEAASAGQSSPGASEPSIPEPEVEDAMVAYIPSHRDPDYLASVLSPLLPDLSFGARAEVKADLAQANVSPREAPDVLVITGPVSQMAKAKRLIETLDRARPMVAVKAVVMQVSDLRARGSALALLADLGGGKLSFGSGEPLAAGAGQFIRLSTDALKAVFAVVREDSRFKVVATPNLAALSGGVANMNAGSQVPTVGAVAFPEGGGGAVQSVVYRDSGISLAVRPTVRGDLIELDVREERSTFVPTTTGVEDSPTLQKSTVNAQVIIKSGESIVLAGLTEESDGHRREGLFGGLLGARSKERSKSELLVVLQAEVVPVPDDVPAGQFIIIHDPEKEETDAA